jgi:hypothetical protein
MFHTHKTSIVRKEYELKLNIFRVFYKFTNTGQLSVVTWHSVGSEWNCPLSSPRNDVGFPGYRQQNYSKAPLKYILLLCIDH